MNGVNKTLYIPLYGKAYVSKKGIFLEDKKAEEIWEKEGFPLKGKSKSKWLAYYMGMRSAVFDKWVEKQMNSDREAVIIHIGCGMDSRVERVGTMQHVWYDVDFPEVIAERKQYYKETETYHMLESDARENGWLHAIPQDKHAIIVMEGVSMYFKLEELKSLLADIRSHFERISVLMDCYTTFAAKASKYKNPINEVGVSQVFGFDDPRLPEEGTGVAFVQEHSLTPDWLIARLPKGEQRFFKTIFAGKMAKKIYRLYEYQ
mgnify:CR=1 FL=1